ENRNGPPSDLTGGKPGRGGRAVLARRRKGGGNRPSGSKKGQRRSLAGPGEIPVAGRVAAAVEPLPIDLPIATDGQDQGVVEGVAGHGEGTELAGPRQVPFPGRV